MTSTTEMLTLINIKLELAAEPTHLNWNEDLEKSWLFVKLDDPEQIVMMLNEQGIEVLFNYLEKAEDAIEYCDLYR